jgi:hypothetical protein
MNVCYTHAQTNSNEKTLLYTYTDAITHTQSDYDSDTCEHIASNFARRLPRVVCAYRALMKIPCDAHC